MNEYNNNNNNNNAAGGVGTENQSPYYTAPGPDSQYGSYAPQQPAQPKQKKGVSAGAVVAICLVCAILAAIAGVGVTYLLLRDKPADVPPAAETTVAPAEATDEPEITDAPADVTAEPEQQTGAMTSIDGNVVQGIYELAKKQVVGITSEITYTNFFGQISAASVSGTGFIISDDGYIITNNHVIENARQGGYDVSVLTYDGTEYTAEIVGYDEANDIAVLKIDATGLTPVTMGSADDIVVGNAVYPVGNPLGELNFTMTSGIISATDRTITTDTDSVPINMFQFDAAVNSGNSGGPVYDAEGEVIGVVTAKTSATGVEGLGFAIPIEDASHIADQLIEYGYVVDRATMGVSAYTVPESVADRYGMVPGAYVTNVVENSPAAEAGIQERDIITAVDDKTVAGSTELTAIVRGYSVGDTAQITLWRNGETMTVPVTFGESQKPVEATPSPEPQQNQPGQYYGDMDDFFRQFFGFGF